MRCIKNKLYTGKPQILLFKIRQFKTITKDCLIYMQQTFKATLKENKSAFHYQVFPGQVVTQRAPSSNLQNKTRVSYSQLCNVRINHVLVKQMQTVNYGNTLVCMHGEGKRLWKNRSSKDLFTRLDFLSTFLFSTGWMLVSYTVVKEVQQCACTRLKLERIHTRIVGLVYCNNSSRVTLCPG